LLCPMSLYLQKQTVHWTWPMGHSLLTCVL
jgi:hypothetical protein